MEGNGDFLQHNNACALNFSLSFVESVMVRLRSVLLFSVVYEYMSGSRHWCRNKSSVVCACILLCFFLCLPPTWIRLQVSNLCQCCCCLLHMKHVTAVVVVDMHNLTAYSFLLYFNPFLVLLLLFFYLYIYFSIINTNT